MNDKQENKLSMYEATDLIMDENLLIWNGIPAIVTAASQLKLNMAAIHAEAQAQKKDLSGYTETKANLREALIAKTFMIELALVAYATASGNMELKRIVDFPRSGYTHARDNDLYDMCRAIHTEAVPRTADLAVYFVLPADITDLDAASAAFLAYIQQPREKKTITKTATSHLADLFAATDSLLKNTLDDLVAVFRTTQPDFYTAYKNARIIIDLGHRKQDNPPQYPTYKVGGEIDPGKSILAIQTDLSQNPHIRLKNLSLQASISIFSAAHPGDIPEGILNIVEAMHSDNFMASALGNLTNTNIIIRNNDTENTASYELLMCIGEIVEEDIIS